MKTWSRRDKRLVALVLALGLVLRLVPALTLPPPPIGGDAVVYEAVAWNLANGRGYTMDEAPPHRPNLFRPPSYPFFIASVYALAGRQPKAVWIAQGILDAITCTLVFAMARRLFASRPLALASLALAACLLPSQVYARYLIPDTFAAFLLALLAWLWLQGKRKGPKHGLALGLVSGVLAYARLEFLLFPVAIGAWLWIEKRQWRFPVWLAVGWLAVVVPWTVRNAWSAGAWTPAARGNVGAALWVGTWGEEGRLWTEEMRGGAMTYVLPPEAYDSPGEGRRARAAVHAFRKFVCEDPDAKFEGRNPGAVLRDMALERIRRNPLKWLRLRFKEAPLLWRPPFANWGDWVANPFALNAFFGWTFFALTVGCIALAWRDPKYHPLWVPVVYYALAHFPFHTEFRYGATMYPLVMLLSVGFFHELRERRAPAWAYALTGRKNRAKA
ncbi:MAG: glycosyltransferase family 39 protein [Acidobacteriota bacterium]|nr:MAG: glycosyltransferase family 39 protein [Acidobacteriota bacterium]